MTDLTEQFRQVLARSTAEDRKMLADWLAGFEQKQQGAYSTYLNAALQMNRELLDDRCIISLPNTPFIHNSLGIPHGGIIATLLDTAMGTLASSRCPEGFVTVTSTFNVHYLSVADTSALIAEAHILRAGRHMMIVEGKVEKSDGELVAHATGSFFIIPTPQ
ncbi:PaaI family thioesterase [Planococcus lenghuensis]|uniref:DUF4442 domain-containing protein n=1 Tax=Planococcus lenghuensis TaxID=2213202 RepID=A0A1Q2L045_9BACL|nr:PaaI family thioesterase [Planococcus lenghuensis]AQQ53818.1 DUF4442 domain-containing protein [Planococcus lenghuensis]